MPDAKNKNPEADRHHGDDAGGSVDRVREKPTDGKRQKRFDVFSFHGLINIAKAIAGVTTVLAAIVGLFAGLDWMIERKLSDESVLRKIAAHSRPSLIFDAKESVIADMGALQYIDPKDIHITKRTAEGWPQRIHVGFMRSVAIPPILTSLYDSAQIRSERGKGLDWEFEISWSVEPVSKDDKDRLYRLEIVP